jgi:hypothetical protein
MGVTVPIDPKYLEIDEKEIVSSCGGSMQLKHVPGGAVLECSWGC